MYRLLSLVFLIFTACGLAEDPRDDENRNKYVSFTDPNFESFCIREFDLNDDKRLSVYEAQRILRMDCSGLQIASMVEISNFSRLQRLDCSQNLLKELDLRSCRALEWLNCSSNELSWIDIQTLRGLRYIDCSANYLTRLQFVSNVSLSSINCSRNDLATLDVSTCSRVMTLVDALQNPNLTTLYLLTSQQIRTLRLDGQTQIVER